MPAVTLKGAVAEDRESMCTIQQKFRAILELFGSRRVQQEIQEDLYGESSGGACVESES